MPEFARTDSRVSFRTTRAAMLPFVLVAIGVTVGCSPSQTMNERLMRRPEPLRLECPDSLFPGMTTATGDLRRDAPALGGLNVLGDHRVPGRFSSVPAVLEGTRPTIEVPFSPTTPPLTVIARDLNRVAESRGPIRIIVRDSAAALPQIPTPAMGLRANLVAAHAYTAGGLAQRELLGQVVFDVAIVRDSIRRAGAEMDLAWGARFIGEHRSKQAYTMARHYEAVLNTAYCTALRAFGDSVAAPNGGVQAALRR